MSLTCELCGYEEPQKVGLLRVGGVDLCEVCNAGHGATTKQAAGWQLELKQWEGPRARTPIETFFQGDDASTVHHTSAELRLPSPGPVRLRCYRRRGAALVTALWRRRLRSGDVLFDRCVHVESPTAKLAADFLGNEGVQSVIMALLGDDAALSINGNRIVYRASQKDYVADGEFGRDLYVLGLHVDRFRDGG